METIKNKGYVEKLYVLLGASIFIHYVLLVLICLLILIEIFVSGEYKKILKNKSLMIVETVLGFSIIMSLFYKNYYGLIAVPILLCLMVGRYYTLIIDDNFKKNNLELIAKFSAVSFFISITEYFITRNRTGYFAYLNPNYLGSIMMLAAIINLYFFFEKKSKINFIIFVLNIITILMSGSRTALAAVVAGILVLFYFYLEKKYFIGCICLFIGYIIGVYFGRVPFLRLDSLAEYFKLRKDIIKIALRIFKKTNMLYGHGNFYYYKYTNYIYPHSHNVLMESLLSYGLVGTVALAGVFLKYLYEVMKGNKRNTLKIALLAGTVVHNSADFTIFWIQTVLLFIIAFSYNEDGKVVN